jgi:hypothetical protein
MVKDIRITADEKLHDKIAFLCDYYGINSKPDLIRFILSKEYRDLMKDMNVKGYTQTTIPK